MKIRAFNVQNRTLLIEAMFVRFCGRRLSLVSGLLNQTGNAFCVQNGTRFRSLSTLAVPDHKLEPIGHVKMGNGEMDSLTKESSQLVYNLPAEWFSQRISPLQRRSRMVLRISDWAKRRSMTPTLLWKLIQGPLSSNEITKYSSNQLARIVYSIGLMKKTQRLVAEPHKVQKLIGILLEESTTRQRLMTYDGVALAQTAFGFTMMELENPDLMRPFALEAIKEHRIRNSKGKSIVNLLESFHCAHYTNSQHVEILSIAVLPHLMTLPTYALPKLLLAWSHFQYSNHDHIQRLMMEVVKEDRLDGFLPTHIEELLTACAKLKLKDSQMVTLLIRELIYSQKWKFMSDRSLPRIAWALGELHHENETHWKQILNSILDPERIARVDSGLLVDVFIGWSKVRFRDSQLLDQLTIEAKRDSRLMQYSTKQLFEVFKSQKALGQVETEFISPFIQRLQDIEKLLKSDLETKVAMFLYPKIKKLIGMKAVAALGQKIFQPICLTSLHTSTLIHLGKSLASLGSKFNICFIELVQELIKEERRLNLTSMELFQLLDSWTKLEYEDVESLKIIAEECVKPETLKGYKDQDLIAFLWLLSGLDCQEQQSLKALVKEIMNRSLEVFTGKGLTMIITCIAKTQCIEIEEIKGLVKEALRDEKLKSLSTSRLKVLHLSLLELNVDMDLKPIVSLIQL